MHRLRCLLMGLFSICILTSGNFAWALDTAALQTPIAQTQLLQQVGRQLGPDLIQMTGTDLQPGMPPVVAELPDPAPPYVNERGEIEIYGSAVYYIRYPNWNEYARGGRYTIVPLDIRGSNGFPYTKKYTHPWDLRKYRLVYKNKASVEILVGGAMEPQKDENEPSWPEDNPSRRIYIFKKNAAGAWVREKTPIFGSIDSGWLDHSYGGNFYQVGATDSYTLYPDSGKEIYFFYEKVSESVPEKNPAYKTEIFARRMNTAMDHAEEREFLILGLGKTPYPATKRTIGGYLMEGPRPVRIRVQGHDYFVIAFSSGDFCTDGYTVNYAWSKNLTGPYQPALTHDGSDFFDLGTFFEGIYGLSWVGRPAIYLNPRGEIEMLFHAVTKSIIPDHDYSKWPKAGDHELWEFFRSIFKTHLTASVDSTGRLYLELAK